MNPLQQHQRSLAEKLLGGTALTADEYEEFVAAIEQQARAAEPLPDSNLIPWPDADELRRLAHRSARRRQEKA